LQVRSSLGGSPQAKQRACQVDSNAGDPVATLPGEAMIQGSLPTGSGSGRVVLGKVDAAKQLIGSIPPVRKPGQSLGGESCDGIFSRVEVTAA
jgi:hypothetical protein